MKKPQESPATTTIPATSERTLTRAHKRVVTQTERDEVAVLRPTNAPDRSATKESKDKAE